MSKDHEEAFKKQRAREGLKNVKLCAHFLSDKGCKFGKKCSFAHSLWDLRFPDKTWHSQNFHRWEQGMDFPEGEHERLIKEYKWRECKWPNWVHRMIAAKAALEGPTEEEQDHDQRHALKRQDWSPQSPQPHHHKRKRWERDASESEASAGERSASRESEESERSASREERSASRESEELAAPNPPKTLEEMALPLVKAMLGFHIPAPNPGRVASPLCRLTLGQVKTSIYLTGLAEGLPFYHSVDDSCIPVLCACGLMNSADWLNMASAGYVLDLSAYSEFLNEGSGFMPWPDAFYPEYKRVCQTLQNEFANLMRAIERNPNHAVWFFCRAGRHRSYGLLLAFLMWAGHIYDVNIVRKIIDPLRNAQLADGKKVELKHWHDMPGWQKAKEWVAYGDFLDHWLHFLIDTNPEHGWEQYGIA